MADKKPGGFRAWRRDTSGNIAIMSALLLPIGFGVAGLAVDVGGLFLERREAQAMADLAAIYAAKNIVDAEQAAVAVFTDNSISNLTLRTTPPSGRANGNEVWVERGRYVADTGVDARSRFVAGARPFNAVRVLYRKPGTAYFAASLISDRTIAAQAVATAPAEAAFSIGTRLASANLSSGILNGLIGGMLGSNLSLDVMDYRALLNTNVELLTFLDAMATELNLTAGTYNDVLASDVTVGRVARALAAVNTDPQANVALTRLFGLTGPNARLKLDQMVDLGKLGKLAIGRGAPGFDAKMGLMEVITAAAAMANGENQVELNLTQDLGGLAAVKVNMAVGEPPVYKWFAVGELGQFVRTSQTQVKIEASIGTNGILGGLLGTSIKLPLYLDIAYAEAQAKKLSCPTGRPASAVVTIAAQPGVADLYIGDVSTSSLGTFGSPLPVADARIVDVSAVGGLVTVRVTGKSNVRIGNNAAKTVQFNKSEIDAGTVKTVSTENIAQSLTTSLVGNLTLDARVTVLGLLPIGLSVPSASTVKATVNSLLSGATAPVDRVVYNVLSALGVRAGEADIRVHGVSCGRSVLVL